jgi:hypothetical protein
MNGQITRYKIVAYILDFIGIILVGIYGASHSRKITTFYQAPDYFMHVGIALIIAGTAIVFYDLKKNAKNYKSK